MKIRLILMGASYKFVVGVSEMFVGNAEYWDFRQLFLLISSIFF